MGYRNFKLWFLVILIQLIVPDSSSVYSQELKAEVRFVDYPFMPAYDLKRMKHPEMFQGSRRDENYFEGWYFKMISGLDSSKLSVIPGISISSDGSQRHAFIQFIDGNSTETWYFRFPIEEFYYSTQEFAVRIGKNYFSSDLMKLDLDQDGVRIKGVVNMQDQSRWPSPGPLNPGIMGWYRFVPFMQCYHGVVSMDHALTGSILLGNREYVFDKGRGYIEKDWGSSMPSSWIWMQSNHFETPGVSFMLSVADIPWLGRSFTGFLGFFLWKGEVYNFATYTGAKLMIDTTSSDKLQIRIKDREREYRIEADREGAGVLMAPLNGSMDRRISESINARLRLTVCDLSGNIQFTGGSSITGLEMVGDLKDLAKNLK